jgi:hypothetical protein
VFVLPPEEYKLLQDNPKFSDVHVEQIIPYPNGQPGFYFVRLRYADNAAAIFETEKAQRKILLEKDVTIDGLPAHVRYSFLDMGEIQQVFDGSADTLIRTREANPLRIQIDFNAPKNMRGVQLLVGGPATRVDVILLDAAGNRLLAMDKSLPEDPNPRWMSFDFGQTVAPRSAWLEILNTNDGEPAHIHFWEVKLIQ